MTATSSNELFQVKIGNYHSYTTYFHSKIDLQLEFYTQEKSKSTENLYRYNVCFPIVGIRGR